MTGWTAPGSASLLGDVSGMLAALLASLPLVPVSAVTGPVRQSLSALPPSPMTDLRRAHAGASPS